jgi:hypothetical protein
MPELAGAERRGAKLGHLGGKRLTAEPNEVAVRRPE